MPHSVQGPSAVLSHVEAATRPHRAVMKTRASILSFPAGLFGVTKEEAAANPVTKLGDRRVTLSPNTDASNTTATFHDLRETYYSQKNRA